jgi:hypothetical protein
LQTSLSRHRLDTVALRTNDSIGPMELLVLQSFDTQIKEILGFERGFNQYVDRITQSLDGADLNAMWREFQSAISLLNRQRTPFTNFLGFPVSAPVERVMYPGAEDFEEASEFGEPKGIRLGVPFSIGYDFKWYDLAIRYTWLFLTEATTAQLRALNSQALEASTRLQFVKILKAVFNSTGRTSTINDGQTAINVYPLYNADGTVPPPYKGTTHSGSHTHYLSSGAATVDPGDLQALEDHLYHHGYRINEGYKLLLFANRSETVTIRTFKLGTNGALYDFIPSSGIGGGVFLPANSGIVGQPTVAAPPGFQAIGTYGPFVIIEEDYVPAGYLLASASGGEKNIGNLVGIREHENAGLRGLMLVKGKDNDYPLTDSFYRQGFGTGVRHRGAGVVMKITAGAFSIPAEYA